MFTPLDYLTLYFSKSKNRRRGSILAGPQMLAMKLGQHLLGCKLGYIALTHVPLAILRGEPTSKSWGSVFPIKIDLHTLIRTPPSG